MGGASGYFSGLKRPEREHLNSDPCPYMRSASFMFVSGFIENKRLSAQVLDLQLPPQPREVVGRHRVRRHGLSRAVFKMFQPDGKLFSSGLRSRGGARGQIAEHRDRLLEQGAVLLVKRGMD